MKLSPEKIQDLVTIAYCLEPLAEKEGCTSRIIDLPEKPLTDFLIAGINTSKYFRYFAQDLIIDESISVFTYLPSALEYTNEYKSSKTINFGLLQLMFFAVKARVLEDYKENVINRMSLILKEESQIGAHYLLAGCEIAWSTSKNSIKRDFVMDKYKDIASLADFYHILAKDYPENSSLHQWSNELLNDFKILSEILNILDDKKGYYLDDITYAYNHIKKNNPSLKIGIIADFCAVAIFLHLSYL